MRHTIILLVLFALAACVSDGYSAHYVPAYSGMVIAPSKVQVYSLGDPAEDARMLARKGYVLLGYSSFNGPAVGHDAVMRQAKKVGAEIVLLRSNYTGTVQGTMPLVLPTTTTSTINSTGAVSGYIGSTPYSGAYGSTGTVTTYGSQTSYVPYRVDRYDQFAAFYAKRPYALGIIPTETPTELKQAIASNWGVYVDIVVEDTPAFYGGMMEGDLIQFFDGETVYSPNDLQVKIAEASDKPVVLTILRGQVEKKIIVQLQ